MLDRGVYETLAVKGKGADFPFDGGTADITGRCKDCSPFGWDLPYTKRTGNAGAVRDLIKGADIAVANFENPAPEQAVVAHQRDRSSRPTRRSSTAWPTPASTTSRSPTTTSATPAAPGLLQTITNVTKRGIAVSGAGKDLAAARKPAILEAGGDEGRDPRLRRDRRRLPRDGDQDRQRAARRPRSSRRTSRPRARPAPTSSSSSRTGAPSTTRRRSPTSRSWPR